MEWETSHSWKLPETCRTSHSTASWSEETILYILTVSCHSWQWDASPLLVVLHFHHVLTWQQIEPICRSVIALSWKVISRSINFSQIIQDDHAKSFVQEIWVESIYTMHVLRLCKKSFSEISTILTR